MTRLNTRSVRVRLTIWYSAALALVILMLAGSTRWALTESLNHALDEGLRHRLIGLHRFLEESSPSGTDHLGAKLRDLEMLGELFQVFGPKGELIAQSDGLARHHVRTQAPPDPGAAMRFRNAGPRRFPVRMATQRIYVNGQDFIIEVADPQGKYGDVLRELSSFLLLALPAVLAVAALGGYWLSNRALRPVDQIINEVRSFDSADLSARLSVPSSGDELQRLSETLNQMLARVEQSVTQVRRFTADASHELRAPMTLIYTAAQFALRRDRGVEELKEALQKILREAKRCTDLINQLLTLARSDAGDSRTELVSTNLTELVKEVAHEVDSLASEKGLQLSLKLPERAIEAVVDGASFRRMLVILLDNAVKYTQHGGITVTLVDDARHVTVSVADTGIGIPANELPFIFDRFWRADQVRSRNAGGAGLGLAIAREIAQYHGAELTAESSIGVGSVFTVRLPQSTRERVGSDLTTEQSV